jgi:hypothetical protein
MESGDKAQKKPSKGSAGTYQLMAEPETEPDFRFTISIAGELEFIYPPSGNRWLINPDLCRNQIFL